MMLGFRKIKGVDISEFKEKYLENPIFLYRKELDKLVKEGLIEVDLNNIRLTNKGLDLETWFLKNLCKKEKMFAKTIDNF